MTEHVISTFEACSRTLRQNDLRQALYDEAALMMDRSLVNLHGTEHRVRRNVEATVFRKNIFVEYERNVLPITLEETLSPFLAAGRGDLVDIGYRIMMNLTVDFTGIDRTERSPEETAELLRLLKEFSLAPALGQSPPEDRPAKRARIEAAMAQFNQRFLYPSLERRRALKARVDARELPADALPRDVLMALVSGESTLGMTEHEFLQEGIFFTMAGAHTTIHSLTHAIHEILQWIAAHPEDVARLRDDPFFVQQCVFESLRLHPSSPVAKRRTTCPFTLASGEEAQAGDTIVVNLRSANRETEIFGVDADQFNPHRVINGSAFAHGISMGVGAHACLGRNLAIGVEPRPGTDPDDHQFGTVPLIVRALLQSGVRADPDSPAELDGGITRISWATYPVLFDKTRAII
ncbi:cytochrome P450 [Novosphingobium sp. ERN07]|uniref:cytochrome P450 n=1 Tax=unclassified Novosphingobium TaxID=2644732 RepID=UPI0013C2C7E3|nr:MULTISPECIES: cytochrome P450 [unclassified Novosphingobium]NLR41627.1 cytochrome P450 [Novosphingobium sp. ERW19]NLR73281.1 cytochrome P450 [Novosphingobium sp. ERN07]